MTGSPEPRRKDIEGLRAIAILLVVLAHARVPMLAGGFVGVDVFFVISGYLITGILLRSAAGARPSLLDFYARRLRRLLPALVVLQLATIALAAWLLAPREQLDQVGGALTAPIWMSNFIFALGGLDYFGASAGQALFLHTWSLGVEEQFYLVWPVLVFLIAGRFGAADGDGAGRRAWWWLAGLAVAGWGFSVWQTSAAPLQAYYLLPARFWQFALGGALVAWQIPGAAHRSPPWLDRGMRAAGLLAIAASALLIDGTKSYPGYWALLPTVGAALVLAAGQVRAGPGTVLESAPLQWIGRLSYGWYLWHWPLLLLGHSLHPGGGVGFALLLSALALGVAALSHRYIEAPVRYSRTLSARPGLTIGLALIAMGVGVLAAQQWRVHAQAWSNTPGQLRVSQAADTAEFYTNACDTWYHSSDVIPCAWGPANAKRTVVVLGDSIGVQWFSAFRAIFREPEWRLIVLTKSACPVVDAPYFYNWIGRVFVECDDWRKAAVAMIVEHRPDLVIVGSGGLAQFDDPTVIEGSRRILAQLSSGSKVIVFAPTPVLPFDGPDCLAQRDWRPAWMVPDDACTTPLATAALAREGRLLREAVAPLPNARLISLDDAVCPHGKCRAEWNGTVVFRDSKHLADAFSAQLAPQVLARIQDGLRPAETAPPPTGDGVK